MAINTLAAPLCDILPHPVPNERTPNQTLSSASTEVGEAVQASEDFF
jgi:hypothetical protein